jgi:flagellar motility protein MotE (MotC chaperone)
MRARLPRIRLAPLTLAVAAIVLVIKLLAVVDNFRGFSSASLPISEARAESAAQSSSPPHDAGGTSHAPPAKHQTQTADQQPPAAAGFPPPSGEASADASPAVPSPQEIEVLQQLAQRRDELDRRAGDLDRRADLLRAGEKRLDQKLKEMGELETTLTGLLKKHDEEQDAKMRSLVKIYENMKPKDAAAIFEKLDMDTLLPVVERMNERKLAPVMANMNPTKAKTITEELSKLRKLVSEHRPGTAG